MPGEFRPNAWIPPEDLTYDEWCFVGDALSLAKGAIHWWLGDWVLAGEYKWGETYAQAIDETKFSLGTLKNDVWIAGSFPPGVRYPDLSWTHHSHCASIRSTYGSATADRFLARAKKRRWSSRELMRFIKRWERLFGEAPARIGASRWSTSDNVSFLPLPPVIDAQPTDESRQVWTARPTDRTFIDWRAVAKSEWRRKRFFEREVDRLRAENRKLADENAELLDEIAQQAIKRSPVSALNWSD